MNKINRKVEYSLMVLRYLGQKQSGKQKAELVTAKDVADRFHAPFDATARVMQMMAKKGVLKSEQGVTGGYSLGRDLKQLTLLELLEIIEGPTEIAKCLQDARCEIHKHCNIVSPIEKLNARLENFYKTLTLQELLMDS